MNKTINIKEKDITLKGKFNYYQLNKRGNLYIELIDDNLELLELAEDITYYFNEVNNGFKANSEIYYIDFELLENFNIINEVKTINIENLKQYIVSNKLKTKSNEELMKILIDNLYLISYTISALMIQNYLKYKKEYINITTNKVKVKY